MTIISRQDKGKPLCKSFTNFEQATSSTPNVGYWEKHGFIFDRLMITLRAKDISARKHHDIKTQKHSRISFVIK